MGMLEKSKPVSIKKTIDVTPSTSIDIGQNLIVLGTKLKEWNFEDLDEISKPISDVMRNCRISFEQTGHPDFLLLTIIIQTNVSYIVTKGLMGNAFNMKPSFDKALISRLGDQYIELSKSVNRANFNAKLMALLEFVYSNKLMLISPT
jgi:hypothetical protein